MGDGVNRGFPPRRFSSWTAASCLASPPDDVIRRARERAGVAGGRRGGRWTSSRPCLPPPRRRLRMSPAPWRFPRALRETGLEPKPVGIGGGTVAALLRERHSRCRLEHHSGMLPRAQRTFLHPVHRPRRPGFPARGGRRGSGPVKRHGQGIWTVLSWAAGTAAAKRPRPRRPRSRDISPSPATWTA